MRHRGTDPVHATGRRPGQRRGQRWGHGAGSFERRFSVVVWLIRLVLAACVLVSVWLLQAGTTGTQRLTDQLVPAAAAASRLEVALTAQESSLRGYLLTGSRALLAGNTQGRADERTEVGELRRLLAGDRAALADVTAIEQRAELWRAQLVEPVLAWTPGTRMDPAVLERGRVDFNAVRAALAAQQRHLSQEQADGAAGMSNASVRTDIAFGLVLIGLVASAGLLTGMVRRGLIRPLDRLGLDAERVSEGEFSLRIESVGPAELVELAEHVDRMRDRLVAALTGRREALATLQRQTEDLRRSNGELEQFASVASHDLQEPLRKVSSFCQLLERRYGDELDERGRLYLAYAADGARRMQDLVNDLLGYARLGRSGESWEPADLGGTLSQALENLAAVMVEAGARVGVPELPTVLGDPAMLARLWQNLIGNAVKFRAPDRSPRITVGCERTADGWELSVADNGIGIEPQFAEKVFLMFQRLHERTAYPGTGIGLAICQKIVEYHGGRIWLDTEYTDGSRFVFTLPEAPPEELA